ncbi:TIGR01244 family phosphatase [Pacificimonas sp. WHA3]|uniref:TIGR01244 family phosphatase n=1 Tax=Pacificimonas pallii TaxID=2827236 RepID=A0ABS6SDX5_9SPHN|nr:TIGR01244 family phosphatase [Pacificimonas pallii]
MEIRKLDENVSVSSMPGIADIAAAAAAGYRSLVMNRPDREEPGQLPVLALRSAAASANLAFVSVPVSSVTAIHDTDVDHFVRAVAELPKPVLAFCRSGTRSATLWALDQMRRRPREEVASDLLAARAGSDALLKKLESWERRRQPPALAHQIVIIGGGAAGIAAAASLKRRGKKLDIAIVEPKRVHHYQPGWTLVGAGLYPRAGTERPLGPLLPHGAALVEGEAVRFDPEHSQLMLKDGRLVSYATLILAMGIELDWTAIPGLAETLGENGVTSNYTFETAPYTWELAERLKGGRAVFTQPPMPIKCAGAPQKTMYLACDHWRAKDRLNDIDVEFHTPGAAMFGVKDFIPELNRYVDHYGIEPHFGSRLIAVDGPTRQATFAITQTDGRTRQETRHFDMLHAVPPQRAPRALRESKLSDAEGWAEVDPETLQHVDFPNVFALGDCCSAPNAKTAAAVRSQAPVVAENLVQYLNGAPLTRAYDGYGSCPLTVARGKALLAEFGYKGKLLPSVPRLLNNPVRATRLGWLIKRYIIPNFYWAGMLKGREWLLKRTPLNSSSHD